ncbi:MAG: hypothetical protein HFJ01_06955 [Lachnospiraceae bacterium]|nr:hypothetical protein [Lachnospiraceae bacterium]
MKKPNPRMNQEEMLVYYRQFDAIEKKYGRYLNLNKSEYDVRYRAYYQYESDRQLSDLTKKEFGDIYANLKLVYEDEKLTEEIIEIYDLVYDKVINQYLNIDGMERLFSENYINFEWEMHMGIDYAGHSMKFYRDHFIHQVRDAYSMDVLLAHGYAEKIMNVLGNKGSSKISRYVCKYINQQLDRKDELFPKGEDDRRNFYLENIVYMSSYMSALFHDIGYPEVANMQSGRNILAYIANVYNFGSGHIDFDRIMTVLQNSLLFRVVSPKEIRERIEDEKIDHGAVSALMFLLHFYENGAIYGLEPYKKCAIEIAGLAIYNHTNSYAYILEGKAAEKAYYQKSVFVLNPISYLLRVCDDLQEWDRIYFEISSNANIIFCSRCHTPIVRRKWEEEKDVYYLCNCNEKKDNKKSMETSGMFGTMFRRGTFPYRRLYNVTVCTELRFRQMKNRHIFELDYDLERLLYVAYVNPSYAKYRIKELNQLKKMFVRQDIAEMTYIQYFMSANILLVKSYILGKYLEKFADKFQLTHYIDLVINEAKADGIDNGDFHEKIDTLSKKIYGEISKSLEIDEFQTEIKEYLNENFPIYIYLYLAMRIGMFANAKENEIRRKKICDLIESLWGNFEKDPKYTADALFLLKDCCKQAARVYKNEDILTYDYYPEYYFEQFCSDKGIENSFFRFGHSDNYQPIHQREDDDEGKNKLDAYTDLYLFKEMLRRIRE